MIVDAGGTCGRAGGGRAAGGRAGGGSGRATGLYIEAMRPVENRDRICLVAIDEQLGHAWWLCTNLLSACPCLFSWPTSCTRAHSTCVGPAE